MTTEQSGTGVSRAGRSAHTADAGMSLVGGHPALDFANTVAWRTDDSRRVERVTGDEGWLRWAVRAGVLGDDQCGPLVTATAEQPQDSVRAGAERAALADFRAVLSTVLDALVDGESPPSAEWRSLRRTILRAREEAELAPDFPLRWQLGMTRFGDLLNILALSAEDLLAGTSLARIRRCEGPGCGWFFLDGSRSGTRRWCSSGDCGNRDRARRHYSRTQQAR